MQTLAKHFFSSSIRIIFACSLLLTASGAYSQTYDTISNWDGIAPLWYASTGGAAVVANPAPDTVNVLLGNQTDKSFRFTKSLDDRPGCIATDHTGECRGIHS